MNHEHQLHGALASPSPPPGVADDWTVPQHWDELTAGDHWVWDTLFARQQSLLHGRVVSAFERGLDGREQQRDAHGRQHRQRQAG